MVDCSVALLDDLDELQLDRVEPDVSPGCSVDHVESLASDGMFQCSEPDDKFQCSVSDDKFQCSVSTELDYSVDREESLEMGDKFHRCSETEMGDKFHRCSETEMDDKSNPSLAKEKDCSVGREMAPNFRSKDQDLDDMILSLKEKVLMIQN